MVIQKEKLHPVSSILILIQCFNDQLDTVHNKMFENPAVNLIPLCQIVCEDRVLFELIFTFISMQAAVSKMRDSTSSCESTFHF